MALQMNMQTPHGFTATDAYIRVEEVMLNNKEECSFVVRAYKSKDEGVAFKGKMMICPHDPAGNGVLSQIYTHLKTLDEYLEAADV